MTIEQRIERLEKVIVALADSTAAFKGHANSMYHDVSPNAAWTDEVLAAVKDIRGST